VIVPSTRLLALALVGVLPVALSGSQSVAIYVAVLWGAACVMTAAVDALLTPRKTELQWTRTHDQKLSLGVDNVISLTLANMSQRNAVIRVRDVTPRLLIPNGNEAFGRCPPRGTWSFNYRLLPIHRGEYRIGPVAARLRGPLGLAWRQRIWPLGEGVKVYPNLLAVRSYESLARRGLLQEIGLKTVRRYGGGTEFEQLRDYTPDDEFRRINWNATARRHRVISVDYRTERSQNVFLLLDSGRMMSTPIPLNPPLASRGHTTTPPAMTRFDHAVNAGLLLAFVAQQAGDRVGLLSFSDRIVRYLPPRPGRRGFLHVTEALHDLEAARIEPDFGLGLRYLAARHAQRSLVILFTDLMQPESAAELIPPLQFLARRHVVLAVTLRDPDLERLAKLDPNDTTSIYQRAVAQSVLDDRAGVLRELRERGALTLDVAADKISAAAVNKYLEIKARHLL
jgi:uncharacterized protein (DUF58 family)